MTNQSIFNYVVLNLRRQANPSFIIKDGLEKPAYRGLFNRKCAVGWLIPDNVYIQEMEGIYPHHLDYFWDNYPNQIGLIRDLQYFHDKSVGACFDSVFPGWEDGWKKIAKIYHLIYKIEI